MNQQELLAVTRDGEDLVAFADVHGLDQPQLDGLAQYATAPGMTAHVFIDRQRVVFAHGPCTGPDVIEAVDGYGIIHTGEARLPGCRMYVSRSPIGELYSVHVIARVVAPV